MIRKFEKKILKKIDFPERLLYIRGKFTEVEGYSCDKKTFLRAIDLKYNIKDEGDNFYEISTNYNDYKFDLGIKKTSGTVFIFSVYVYNNNALEDTGFRQYGEVFHEFPLDKNKYNENFGFNNFEEMKEYLQDMITLFDDFVEEYINQLKAGETP